MQICVFDNNAHEIYLAYAEYGTGVVAYYRSMMHIDLKPFWQL
jgi:hypothetical protein